MNHAINCACFRYAQHCLIQTQKHTHLMRRQIFSYNKYRSNSISSRSFTSKRRFSSRTDSPLSSISGLLMGIAPSSYALLVFPCFTLYLGIWQVNRRKWKLGLIEELDHKTKMPAVELPLDLEAVTSDREYEKFILRGTFDHSRESFIGPRTLIGDTSAGGLISSSNTIGVHVVTPFKISGRNVEVLVNRGWIPMSVKHSPDKTSGRVNGEVTIGAVYRLSEKRGQFVSSDLHDQRSRMWLRRDITAIAEELGTNPLWFDADEQSSVSGGPVGGQTRVQLRNEHFSYILTWFSLTAIMLIMWCNRFMRRRNTEVHRLMQQQMKRG